MTILRVQGNKRGGIATGSSISLTLDSTPVSGNVLIATISSYDYVVSSITQTNVTWTKQVSTGVVGSMNAEIWLGVVGASASKDITVNLSGTVAYGATVNVCEYSGILTTGFLDKTSVASGYGTNHITGTIVTTTQDVELWIGSICSYYYATATPQNGFALLDGAGGDAGDRAVNSYLEKIVSAKSTAASGVTASANCNYAGCIATFKATVLITHDVLYDSDVILQKLGLTVTDSIDALFKQLGITKTYNIDMILTRPPHPYDVDAVLEALGVTKPFSVDMLLKITDEEIQYSIDMRLTYLTWAAYFIDIQLKKLGIITPISIDVLFKKLNVTKTDSIDVLFKKLKVTTTTNIDVILGTLIPPTPPAEVPETLKITNGTSTLWARPISWKENQSCNPAIRPLPLAESEYLDSDTWVLKPRTIECKIRLSDREKDMFEKLYNDAPVNGINKYLDFYLLYNDFTNNAYTTSYTWHYLVWITDKSYKFVYVYQNNRYVRWWTVTLTCDVQAFSGSSSTLPTWDDDQQSNTYGYTTYLEDSKWSIYNNPYYDPIAKAVKISDERLDHILSFTRDDEHPPMIPNWINQLAEVDSYIWNECVLDTSYTCRMTNAEKYHMDLLLQAHKTINYEDYIHNLFSKAGIAGGEQIVNGGFENIAWMTGWDYKADYSVTSTNPYSGIYCVTTDAYDLIEIGQTLNPIPFDTIKSFKMWLRTDNPNTIFVVSFETTDGDDYALIPLTNTSGVWTQYDLKAVMTSLGLITGNLEFFNIEVYSTTGNTAIDYVSLNAESRGAWIASVEAQWNPTNWIKPWEVSIALKANNSEIESRTAIVTIYSSTCNDEGNMFIDEITVGPNPNATSSTLPWVYDGDYGKSNSCDVGVHMFYFFQPAGSIWDYWLITGDAIKLISQGDSPNGIGGEHILTVLIYGTCSIGAIFQCPPTPAIILDSYLNTDPSSRSEGLITVDGTGYSLPYSLTGSVIATPYTLEFWLDPCSTSNVFDHWESSVNITIVDPSSDSTTFTLDSGSSGTITAVYIGDFQIDIDYDGYSNPCNPAKITVDGIQYTCPDTIYEFFGDWTTSATAGSGDIQHIFDHWETTGGISVDDIYATPTTIHVTANGTLTAVFHTVVWEVITNHPSDPNQGQWSIDGSWWDNLPYGPYNVYIVDSGSPMPLKWRANGNGGTFSHWSFTGGIHIADVNSANTTFWVSDSFTLTANYT